MSFTYPSDERIESYETLDLVSQTDKAAIYRAPDFDFTVIEVVIDKENWARGGLPVPSRIVVSVALETVR